MWPNRRGGGRETAAGRAPLRLKSPPLHRSRWRPRTLRDRQVRSTALEWLLPLLKSALVRSFRPSTLYDSPTCCSALPSFVPPSIGPVPSVDGVTPIGPPDGSSVTSSWAGSRRPSPWVSDDRSRASFRTLPSMSPSTSTTDPTTALLSTRSAARDVRTKEERGTHRAHRFASLSILLPNYRLVASLRFHPRNGGTLAAVRAALHDFHMAGGQLKAVFLDRGFYTYAVLSWLKDQGLTAVVPLRLGARQRKRWERGRRSYSTTHVLKGLVEATRLSR